MSTTSMSQQGSYTIENLCVVFPNKGHSDRSGQISQGHVTNLTLTGLVLSNGYAVQDGDTYYWEFDIVWGTQANKSKTTTYLSTNSNLAFQCSGSVDNPSIAGPN